jgi:hypothetical protein
MDSRCPCTCTRIGSGGHAHPKWGLEWDHGEHSTGTALLDDSITNDGYTFDTVDTDRAADKHPGIWNCHNVGPGHNAIRDCLHGRAWNLQCDDKCRTLPCNAPWSSHLRCLYPMDRNILISERDGVYSVIQCRSAQKFKLNDL